MPILTRTHVELSATRDAFPFGPWPFTYGDAYDEFVGAYIQIAATTLAQIVGGVSPSLAAIVTIEYLMIVPDQAIKIGLHGVNAQSSGFTLDASGLYLARSVSINALQIYNTAAETVIIFLGIGGRAT